MMNSIASTTFVRRRAGRAVVLLLALASLAGSARQPAPAAAAKTVRVAVIGGINDHDFWQTLSDRFEARTGIRVDLVASGNRDATPKLFEQGGVDFVTLPSSDAIEQLVTDGLASDARPWVQTDLILVGPATDPAGVKGSTTLADALTRIAKGNAPLLIHGSGGADVVLRRCLSSSRIDLPPESVMYTADDHQRSVLAVAAERKAYTLIARIPFKSGKLSRGGLVALLEGDPALRRPMLFALANPNRFPSSHAEEARALATFLLSEETQTWIAGFGKGVVDERALHYRVSNGHVVGELTTPPATRAADDAAR